MAERVGATAAMIAAPAKPRPTPAAAPAMPVTSDSPSTWAMIRRVRQPSALSVPNSRTCRDTAAIVNRLARAKAASSTSTDTHLPRSFVSLAALDSDPVTSLAKLVEAVTMSPGSSREISLCTAGMSAALAAAT